MINLLEPFNFIKAFVFDVDGVFTDSRVTVFEDGSLIRVMSIRDGYAVKAAINAGYQVVVITGGSSIGVVKRLKRLGVKDVYWGIQDKMAIYEEFLNRNNFEETQILYMGDDIPDIQVMRRVGLPTCPADAANEVRKISQYISPIKGGAGCVRDVIEKVMKLQGTWPTFED